MSEVQVVEDKKKPAGIKGYLESPEVQQKVQEMLKERAPQFITSLLSAVSSSDKLAKCQPASVFGAALTAASLDLPINSNLGFAYIIPYEKKTPVKGEDGKTNWVTVSQAQFQMGYKGFIQLAQRSGLYKTIGATEVYEGQLVKNDPLMGAEFDWSAKTSDEVIGYAAMFKLLSGFEMVKYMTVEELKAHGAKFSQSYGYDLRENKNSSLWSTDFHSMGIKTVLKLLISKYGPMSTDLRKAVDVDQGVVGDDGVHYLDNEKIEPVIEEKTEEEKEAIKAEAKATAERLKGENASEPKQSK